MFLLIYYLGLKRENNWGQDAMESTGRHVQRELRSIWCVIVLICHKFIRLKGESL